MTTASTTIYPEGWTPNTPTNRWITVLAFRNRFSKAEKIGIEMAAIDDPNAATALRQQSAALRSSMKDVDSARYIDLDRPDTRTEVQNLEAAGLLGVGRALEVLDAEVQPHERYVALPM